MGQGDGHDQAERGLGVAGHERAKRGRVEPRGLGRAAALHPLDHLERIAPARRHVDLAGDAHAVPQIAQVVDDAAGAGTGGRVVPAAAVAHRVQAGEEFGAAGLAHGLGQVGAVEGQALAGEAVDVRRADVGAAVERQVGEGGVVAHDDQDVGPVRGRGRGGVGGGRSAAGSGGQAACQQGAGGGGGCGFQPGAAREHGRFLQERGGHGSQPLSRRGHVDGGWHGHACVAMGPASPLVTDRSAPARAVPVPGWHPAPSRDREGADSRPDKTGRGTRRSFPLPWRERVG